ncbi:galactose oxidase [Sphingobacterium corticibacterium]|uniref:Galactose oxidase n=1 Tax=Sphingobacterium corticibacterium TaxID=2484746 RepID=A0A4Q6XQK3_9SPHI|nr:galactose oxidase [Sphingobacterium corticibacterium]RZF58707.1 galactose oxidase [Sphingobacterium corticibacterium]
MRLKLIFIVLLAALSISINTKVCSQPIGLGFASHEIVQDKRTGLDLSANKTICLDRNFELSFDLSFYAGHSDYFGYIFRIISDEKQNIDLIYDYRLSEKENFKITIGDKPSKIKFSISLHELFRDWHAIKLKFDVEQNELQVFVNGNLLKDKVKLKKSCYKILFGTNNYKDFKVTDVPPMKLKNIKLKEDNNTAYFWPLDGIEEDITIDENNGLAAAVFNPIWIKKQHRDWELISHFSIKGAASLAFDSAKNNMFLIGEDSLFVYNIINKMLKPKAYPHTYHLLAGNQSLFASGRLLNLYIDQKLVSTYDSLTNNWTGEYVFPDVITHFWHYNKFYSSLDSSLYMIGGYGQFKYKSNVYKYHVPSKEWTTVNLEEGFVPRYLAALGQLEDGVYILGGYGSTTGEQILNPRNLYDLIYFDIKNKAFRKIFELNPREENFAFANSMVIDAKSRTYYALTFPNHRYNSHLQLIQGSLDSAYYKLLGNELPYTFHDIHSFADLYYSPKSKQFIAVTMFHNEVNNNTDISVYVLRSPPLEMEIDKRLLSRSIWLYVLLFAGSAILFFLFLRWRKARVIKKEVIHREETPHDFKEVVTLLPLEKTPNLVMHEAPSADIPKTNTIFLFGGFQIYDKEGNDITKLFSPLIKELLLITLLYTIRWERGISSQKLTEILWFDKTTESARNNRSVNIAKLKGILDKLDGFQISKETGYWKINVDAPAYVDYKDYLDIVNRGKKISKMEVNRLTEIVQRGSFLSSLEYEWLDQFKSEISNDVIDTYLHYMSTLQISEDPEFIISLANYIFYFDPVNEEAMVLKCKALVYLGKHSLAKTTFDNFSKEYKAIYDEDFYKNFNEILE